MCREERLMHHLAGTFRMILGDIDLTVTDRHVAMVLAGCLQVLRRRHRVERCLLPREQWQAGPPRTPSSWACQGCCCRAPPCSQQSGQCTAR